ncbi:carbonic anhydrase [Marinilactibacillus kalidii]|uniref:carbonic anhydrase n=1 Tax=Marinilactibacillus kalidii TaxID=2820274 RepID=UPI001ABE5BE9|nr:carbonic anhydrase [Marinilactibacillus kalidii]
MLERLKDGLTNFRNVTYEKYKHLYHDLEQEQHPHTLFIACSDSRVNPERLLDSQPGEIFMVRNIANTVPAYELSQNDPTTVASIEFAVEVLGVKEIIICGHSNCGGCAAAISGQENLTHIPFTQHYLKPLESVKEKLEAHNSFPDENAKATQMEHMNVIEQVDHLKSYPNIRKRLESGTLEIEGWHYDIKSGNVFIYDETTQSFLKSEEYQSVQ